MKYSNLILFSFLLLAFSCTQTHQYDVYVKNETDGDLTITYKSDKDKKGAVQETIIIVPDENRKIISTINFDQDPPTVQTRPEDCKLVAEYVRAVDANNRPSKLDWCSNKVGFQVVDIGQGEFLMTFTEEDF